MILSAYFYVLILTKSRFMRIMCYVIKYFHHIMRIMWLFFAKFFSLTSHQSKSVDLLAVDVAAFHGIDARGVNG